MVGEAVKVTLLPLQMLPDEFEEMETEGVTPAEDVTASEVAGLLPQPLTATTEIVPEEEPAVVVMELVLDVPDHPEGSVQV